MADWIIVPEAASEPGADPIGLLQRAEHLFDSPTCKKENPCAVCASPEPVVPPPPLLVLPPRRIVGKTFSFSAYSYLAVFLLGLLIGIKRG